MILSLSCLTHAELILGVWLKADASGPLGDKLRYLSLSTTESGPHLA
jgi:hypothetical protein